MVFLAEFVLQCCIELELAVLSLSTLMAAWLSNNIYMRLLFHLSRFERYVLLHGLPAKKCCYLGPYM